MRFRLFYEGPLYAGKEEPWNGHAKRDRRADHKHTIRRDFHRQLRELWSHDKALLALWTNGEKLGLPAGDMRRLCEAIPDAMPTLGGFRFLPLVCESFDLLCKIDVLMLRRDEPGRAGIFQSRDLDNRLKILFDALKMPRDLAELGTNTPQEGEDPLYVLVQADDLISHVSIETGTLLDPPDGSKKDDSYVRLLIAVTLTPSSADMFNLSFAGG